MRAKVYVEASSQRFFKLPFEWSATPLKEDIGKTETAVIVETSHGNFLLKGVLKDVRVNGNLGRILFYTESSPEDIKEAVLPGGKRLHEVSNWLLD